MKIKISDTRICVIKIIERNWSVGVQKLEKEIKSLRESEAENNEWLRERMRFPFITTSLYLSITTSLQRSSPKKKNKKRKKKEKNIYNEVSSLPVSPFRELKKGGKKKLSLDFATLL